MKMNFLKDIRIGKWDAAKKLFNFVRVVLKGTIYSHLNIARDANKIKP